MGRTAVNACPWSQQQPNPAPLNPHGRSRARFRRAIPKPSAVGSSPTRGHLPGAPTGGTYRGHLRGHLPGAPTGGTYRGHAVPGRGQPGVVELTVREPTVAQAPAHGQPRLSGPDDDRAHVAVHAPLLRSPRRVPTLGTGPAGAIGNRCPFRRRALPMSHARLLLVGRRTAEMGELSRWAARAARAQCSRQKSTTRPDEEHPMTETVTFTKDTETVRNGVDTATMFATLDAIKAQPEIAKFRFRARNRWLGGSPQPLDDQGLLRRLRRGHLPHRGLHARRRRARDPAGHRHGPEPGRVPAARPGRLRHHLAGLLGRRPRRTADLGRVDARGRPQRAGRDGHQHRSTTATGSSGSG